MPRGLSEIVSGQAAPVFVGEGAEGAELGSFFDGEGIGGARRAQPGERVSVEAFSGLLLKKFRSLPELFGGLESAFSALFALQPGEEFIGFGTNETQDAFLVFRGEFADECRAAGV